MFTEYEIQTFLDFEEVHSETEKLRKEFILKSAPFLEITTHDFLSLIMMTPAIGIANANGSISLFEEMALNKMARKMSKGGYFMKSDPVARAMKFLIKDIEHWEPIFLNAIKLCMKASFDMDSVETTLENEEPTFDNFPREIMVVPYVLIRFLTSFFLQGQVEILEIHNISKVEFDKVKKLGDDLGISHLNIFKAFCTTFNVK